MKYIASDNSFFIDDISRLETAFLSFPDQTASTLASCFTFDYKLKEDDHIYKIYYRSSDDRNEQLKLLLDAVKDYNDDYEIDVNDL